MKPRQSMPLTLPLSPSTGGEGMKEKSVVVLVTCPRTKFAERLAHGLIQENLAACVNLTAVRSVYRWKGKIEDDRETLLIIKTTLQKFPLLRRYVVGRHPYKVPEIIALPIAQGHAPYLEWVCASVSNAEERLLRRPPASSQ